MEREGDGVLGGRQRESVTATAHLVFFIVRGCKINIILLLL
jgi:hypothetical protein